MAQSTATSRLEEKPLWLETPLLYSSHLSESAGASVYLKLENLQPSHSFKYRGISHLISTRISQLGPGVKPHLVIASSGNAGLATACVARRYGLQCTVFIPATAAQSTVDLLKREKAEVVMGGAFYGEAYKVAQAYVQKDPVVRIMVESYDDPLIWEGHGSMIQEIKQKLPCKPDAIFCNVGGGGLLGGILVGCEAVGWEDVPIITLETIGADCFYHSMSLNKGRFNSEAKVLPEDVDLVYSEKHDVHLAHFRKFTSKAASSLGASQPAEAVLRKALDWKGGVKTLSIPDEMALEASALFADNQKMLVELACATTLAPAYHPALFDSLVPKKKTGEGRVVIFVVCGGFKTSIEEVAGYQEGYKRAWKVKCDDGTGFETI